MTRRRSEGLDLRVGDWVEVRSKEEILSTLDRKGQLESMPFMPQMFEYCGRRLRVEKSAHKTCDTISGATTGRRVSSAVHLEGVRCDGRDYERCDAACLIFWKTAWLKRADATATALPLSGKGCTVEDVTAGTRIAGASDGEGPTCVCQATELLRASTHLPWWDLRQYLEDYRSGNASLRQVVDCLVYAVAWKLIRTARWFRTGAARVLIRAYDRFQALRGGVPYPRKYGKIPLGQQTPSETLALQPGELVRVKSYDQILMTLNTDNKNRGLYFDAEHVPYCGGTYRVRSRVNRIVDEKTGRMLAFKTGSVILEGVVCQACYSNHRMLCPRAIFPYWREIWLERVDATTTDRPAAQASAPERVTPAPERLTSPPRQADPR